MVWTTTSSSSAGSGSSKAPSTSFPHHRRVNTTASDASSSKSTMASGVPGRAPIFDTEDAWGLEDDDDEEDEVQGHSQVNADAGSISISRVAAQAGLGRKASTSSLSAVNGKPPPKSSYSNGNASTGFPSPSIVSSTSSTPAIVASSRSAPQLKERGRQASYGFWERLSGFGVGSSSSTANGSSSSLNLSGKAVNDEAAAEASGYTRFDDQLELEDNFDGTYSVAAHAAGTNNSTLNGPGKLMAPANLSRPNLLGAAGQRSSGKVPQMSSAVTAMPRSSKGKTRSIDSTGSATVVGTPRPKSPFTRGKRSDKPKDDGDMRRCIRKDIDDVMEGVCNSLYLTIRTTISMWHKTDPVNLLKNLSLSFTSPAIPASPAVVQGSDYYSVVESPPVSSTSTFPYDPHLADLSPEAAASAAELAKTQAQARRDATRRERFIECLKKDTVDISRVPFELQVLTSTLLTGFGT